MLLAFMSFVCGLIRNRVAAARWEAKRALYLAIPFDGDAAAGEPPVAAGDGGR